MNSRSLPGNRRFAFTIIDDTDDACLPRIKQVYDVIARNGLRTTKTVWVYPPRDAGRSRGDCLANADYLAFVRKLLADGFEIGLHNVGSGNYVRAEIVGGLEEFRAKLGFYPYIHVNHACNRDNVYSGSRRFTFPLDLLVRHLYARYADSLGDAPGSAYFWGDRHKKHIRFARNYEVEGLNTVKAFPHMPCRERRFDAFANYWFASTFAPNQWVFNRVVTRQGIDRLESEGGICILYTHLGYYHRQGGIDPGFTRMIEYIGSRENGWFVPVGTILDHLLARKKRRGQPEHLPFFAQQKIQFHTLKTRLKYRYIRRIDDLHFKKSAEHEG